MTQSTPNSKMEQFDLDKINQDIREICLYAKFVKYDNNYTLEVEEDVTDRTINVVTELLTERYIINPIYNVQRVKEGSIGQPNINKYPIGISADTHYLELVHFLRTKYITSYGYYYELSCKRRSYHHEQYIILLKYMKGYAAIYLSNLLSNWKFTNNYTTLSHLDSDKTLQISWHIRVKYKRKENLMYTLNNRPDLFHSKCKIFISHKDLARLIAMNHLSQNVIFQQQIETWRESFYTPPHGAFIKKDWEEIQEKYIK
jgi:hypothetical protein